MRTKLIFIILICLIYIQFVSASFGFDNTEVPSLRIPTAAGTVNNYFNHSINFTTNMSYDDLALTNESNSFTGNQTTTGWWNGLFNWSIIGNWFGWNGATLSFNETKLNETIADYTSNISDNFVPYDGATGPVDLGIHDLSASDINAGNDLNALNDLDVADDADIGGDLTILGLLDVLLSSLFHDTVQIQNEIDTAILEIEALNASESAQLRLLADGTNDLYIYTYGSNATANYYGLPKANTSYVDARGQRLIVGTFDTSPMYLASNRNARIELSSRGDFIPFDDDDIRLGNVTQRWQDLYLTGEESSGLHFVEDDTLMGNLSMDDDGNLLWNGVIMNGTSGGSYNATYSIWAYNQTLDGDNFYIFANSTSYYFNETQMNITIADYTSNISGSGVGNASWNESYADTLYAPNTTVGIEWLINGTIGRYVSNLSDTNITYYSDGDWILKNSTNGFNFNTSQLSTTYYNVTQVSTIAGTINAGSLADTQHQDGNYDGRTLNFTEVAGSPGLDLRMNFTGIDDFNQGVMRYKTSSLAGAFPIIQVWNYDDSSWEDYPPMSTSSAWGIITQPVFDATNHISGEVVQMRIYKASNGNINNHYYVDWVAISKGFGTPSGNEIDPYSFHKNESINNPNNNITGNWFNGKFNWTTLNNWLKFDGSQLSYNESKLNNTIGQYVSNLSNARNPFNQVLNTTSDVSFSSAIVDNLIAGSFLETPLVLFTNDLYYDDIILSFIDGDSYERFRIKADGNMSWGDGTNDFDTYLWRSGTNTLNTGNLNINGISVGTYLYNFTDATFGLYNSTWDNLQTIKNFNVSMYDYINEQTIGDFYFNNFSSSFTSNWSALGYDKWMYNQTQATFNLYNSTWDNRGTINTVNTTLNTKINTKLNITDQRYNETAWVQAQGYLTSEPAWSGNFTNLQVDCGTGYYAYGVYNNGSLKCREDESGTGTGTGDFNSDAYYNKTDYSENDIGWMAVNKTRSGSKTILTIGY